MALRLAGTSRKETLAVSAQYQQQHAAAVAEAERAARASAQALHEDRQTLTGYPRLSLLAQGQAAAVPPPGDVRAMEAVPVSLQQRVPVLAARLDARVTEDVQQLRSSATAQRTAAARHGAAAQEIRREAALREELRAAAPVRHAREADERTAALRSAPAAPSRTPQAPALVRPTGETSPSGWTPGAL
ncbi:hypothetical protein ACWGVR_33905 [Streptomyces xanthophaeus]